VSELIIQLIRKIRELSASYPEINQIANLNAKIQLTENNEELKLDSIIFYRYNKLQLTETQLIWHKYGYKREIIAEFTNWYEFLRIKELNLDNLVNKS
jgi:hypothetical protein